MHRDKQSPLELIKYTGYIQESFGRMRVRVAVVVGGGDAIRVLQHYYMFSDRGWRRRPSASIFFVFILCWRERAAGGSAHKDLAENQNMSSLFRCFFTSLNLFPLGANERTKGMRSHMIFQVICCFTCASTANKHYQEATVAFLI